jgi:excisionase family DNA binding protein
MVETLLKVPEVAERLRLSRSLVYELIARNDIRAIRIGRSRRVGHPADDEPIVDLDVDLLTVDVSVIEVGRVTIAGSTKNKLRDAYGVEFDRAPADARALGRQLIEAATAAGARTALAAPGLGPTKEV